jgi:hypothetical protein
VNVQLTGRPLTEVDPAKVAAPLASTEPPPALGWLTLTTPVVAVKVMGPLIG